MQLIPDYLKLKPPKLNPYEKSINYYNLALKNWYKSLRKKEKTKKFRKISHVGKNKKGPTYYKGQTA